MKLSVFTGGFAQTNGWLLETADGNLLVDAPDGIAGWLNQRGVRIDAVLLTHQHYDHVVDAAALQKCGAPLFAFAPYSQDLTLEKPAREWGMPISVEPFKIDTLIVSGEDLTVCGLQFSVAHVPGHATDSLTFYLASEGIVFAGDALFQGSIGRTDLPGGDTETLLDGIRRHLLTLDGSTRVLPGHGPETTIAAEAAHNPFL
jgi:glyoxylase-like metal-dependent hydrolase (beta-lactamase superfamily II)